LILQGNVHLFPDIITPGKIDFSDQKAPTLANQNTRIPEHQNTNFNIATVLSGTPKPQSRLYLSGEKTENRPLPTALTRVSIYFLDFPCAPFIIVGIQASQHTQSLLFSPTAYLSISFFPLLNIKFDFR
jgi:hypothetical protein